MFNRSRTWRQGLGISSTCAIVRRQAAIDRDAIELAGARFVQTSLDARGRLQSLASILGGYEINRAERMSLKDSISAEAAASIDGALASLDDAAAAAARLLARSRQPLIAGLGADIDGARAAIALAERVGGVIEHTHSAALLRDLDCLRETGIMLTTPGEARVRADVVLLVGDGLTEAWPHLNERLLALPARPEGADIKRRIVWLAPQSDAAIPGFDGDIEVFAAGVGAMLAANLAALRARVKGRPVAQTHLPLAALDALAGIVKGARFGVAVWTAESLGPLEIEMLHGLVRDLNDTTRFSTLPLPALDNGEGVLAACGWTTGFPMRTGFGAGVPIHDPWRFDAERLITSGETDCVLWISAFGAAPPAWRTAVNFIALCEHTTQFAKAPNVRIAVGHPGVDHDAVMHSSDTGTLVAATASARSSAPSVAEALERIGARLGDADASSC
jgi:formylmethanofuran dehydrogenase subunit B